MKRKFEFKEVFEVVRLIPRGRVTSYGAIAAYLGVKSAAQAVGWAIIASHKEAGVPSHRVLNRNGLLTGQKYYATPMRMQELLEAEGIIIKDNQVQNLDSVFWDPVIELP